MTERFLVAQLQERTLVKGKTTWLLVLALPAQLGLLTSLDLGMCDPFDILPVAADRVCWRVVVNDLLFLLRFFCLNNLLLLFRIAATDLAVLLLVRTRVLAPELLPNATYLLLANWKRQNCL